MNQLKLKRNNFAFAIIGSAAFSMASFSPNVLAATLTGYKFNDVNKDQQCNMCGSLPSEPIFANETIIIRNDETSEKVEIKTDKNGYFSFEGVGDFSILLMKPPSGWNRTTPVEGSNTIFYQVTLPNSNETVMVNIGISELAPPNSAPKAYLESNNITAHTGKAVIVKGTFEDADNNDSHTIIWSVDGTKILEEAVPASGVDMNQFEDRTSGLTAYEVTPNSSSITYLFDSIGAHTVEMRITDSQDAQDTATMQVIAETPPEPSTPIGWLPFDDDDGSTEITPPKIDVVSSDTEKLIVNITVPGANVVDAADDDGETYYQFNIQGSGYIAAPGKPMLPMLSRFIAIPKGANVTIEVLDSEFTEVSGYNIYPAQEAPTDEDNAEPLAEFELDSELYETNAFFPADADIAILDDHASIRGTTVAMLRISPVQFNPVTKTLRVYSHVKVKVSFHDGDDDFIEETLRSPSYDQMFRQLLLNAPTALASDDDAAFDANNSLLIITHPNFLEAADTLAAWKIKKGIHTTVATTKDTGESAESIKKYVKNAYENANPAPTYLLLIGDAEFIPTNYVTRHPSSKHSYTKIGTDLYYVTVDGNDYFPDISMGRLSVDTLAQAKKRIADIIGYEKASVKKGYFYKNATIAGYFQHFRQGEAERRFAQTSEDIAIYLSKANYSVDRIYFTEEEVYPTKWSRRWFGGGLAGNSGDPIPANLRKPDFKWDGDAADITKTINNGRFLVVHRDHGKVWGWKEPHYDVDNVLALRNGNKLPVILSINCKTGWFDNETDDKKLDTPASDVHFSEAWERNPNGGAVGMIAATRISYSGYNDRLAWGWMDAIWSDFEAYNPQTDPAFEMGAVLDYGKYYLATKYTADTKRKAEFEMFHWFGDPTMQIWTEVPKQLVVSHNPTISEDATSIEVTLKVSDAVISISRAQPENGTILGKAFSKKGSATKIALNSALQVDEEIHITVTKHNYRPYEAIIKVEPKNNDPCANPTITSNAKGDWTKQPSDNDVIQILAGHTVETDSVKAKTLCIEPTGTLTGIPGAKLKIELSLDEGVFHNKGTIRSADGNDGDCPAGGNNASNYLHATNGMNLSVDVGTFINEGNIIAGNGGIDSPWKCLNDSSPGAWKYTFSNPPGRLHKSNHGAWFQQDNNGETIFGFPSIGGYGGTVGIFTLSTITNSGTIQAGIGGNADSLNDQSDQQVHGTNIGGRGGNVMLNPMDIGGSSNTGTLKAGCGGDADIPECCTTGDILCNDNNINPSRAGIGGKVNLNVSNGNGIVQGCPGSIISWDPTTLTTGSNTLIKGSDHVEIYGNDGWLINLTGLIEKAISANKTITIAIGKGGTLDLRGISSKVFYAGEKMSIFADHILLDEGVTIEQLIEAPVIIVETGKILYRVAITAEQQIIGDPNDIVSIPLKIHNNSPKRDTYSLEITGSENWQITGLPDSITVESLATRQLSLNVVLPSAAEQTNVITVTAISQAEPEVRESNIIRVVTTGDVDEEAGKFTAFGTIRDKFGNPIPDATILLGHIAVMTNNAGFWEITGLQEGEYTITANQSPYTFAPVEFALGNEEFKQEVVITPLSALNVKIFTKPRKPKQGENITLIANITNGGSEIATGVVLTDILPKGFRLISIEALDGGECNTDPVSCSLPNLVPGATAKVQLEISNPEANKWVAHTATVMANEYPADVHKKRVNITPYFSVNLYCTPKKVMPQGELNCMAEVIVSSLAPNMATGVELVITLPRGIELKAVDNLCDTSELPTLTCSLTNWNSTDDGISRAIVRFDEVLIDPGLLVLTHHAKVTANEYPVHTNRARTKVFIPADYLVDLALVIDVTGSMQPEMNGTQRQLKEFIANEESPLTALVVFRDEVTVKAVTTDMDIIASAIEKMRASGGGTCPEASIEALEVAITHVKEGGTIFFVTDASPYDDANIVEVITRLKAKNIQLHVIITGDCSNRESWNQL